MSLADEVRTPDGFLRLLQHSEPQEFAELVREFNDADRRKSSKVAQDHAKQLRAEERKATSLTGLSPTEMMRRIQGRHERKNVALAAAHLGLLAVAPKSANMFPLPSARSPSEAWMASKPTEHEVAAISILLSRRPDWAQAWFERQLRPGDFGYPLTWDSITRVLEDGLCTAPDNVEFATLANALVTRADLAKEPKLAEYIWLQFRHSTGFLICDGKLRKFDTPIVHEGWQAGVEWLWSQVNAGLVDRERVIDESLAAFWRDFNNLERSTLAKLLDALELTSDEFVRRQGEFRKLLAHEAPAVVTFALKCLKAMKTADQFDAEALIAELPLVMSITKKTQPKSALVLLKTLVGKNQNRIERAVNVAVRALQHPELDVQEAAVKLLEQWAAVAIPVHELRDAAHGAFPTVRPRIDALLEQAGVGEQEATGSDSVPQVEPSQLAKELFERMESCAPTQRQAWKLDESLSAALAGQMLPVVDINAVPFELPSHESVEPLASLDELIDEVNAFVEDVHSPLQVERILDGISRFGTNTRDDFGARVAPILHRLKRDANGSSLSPTAHSLPAIERLIFDWLSQSLHLPAARKLPLGDWMSIAPAHMAEMLDYRAVELRSRFLRTRAGFPLLSLPTHDHGWVDPDALVERCQVVVDASEPLASADLRIALLRLPPGTRFAVAQLEGLPDDLQRLLRYVGGAPPELQPSDDPSLWLAAGRSRGPRESLTELSQLKIPDVAWGLRSAEITVLPENSPSAVEHRAWQEQKEAQQKQAAGEGPTLKDRMASAASNILMMTGLADMQNGQAPLVSIEPRGAGNDPAFPTVVIGSRAGSVRRWFEGQLPPWVEQWQATHWPANTDGSLAMGMIFMLCRMDGNASSWEPVAPSLGSLLWPERAWSRTAVTALWLPLFAKDADARAVARDALIEGILDGRAHPDQLTPVLLQLLQHPWLKLNRLSDALSEVVRVSPWSALVVSAIVDQVIADWSDIPRDAYRLLSVQLDAVMQVDGCLSTAAKSRLETLSGSSKTAKLARQLLTLSGSPDTALWKAALLEGVQHRFRRAADE